MRIEITETDLWNDGDGWSANGCVANRYTVDVADDASDLAIARAVKAAAGWTNVGKRDDWCGSGFGPWRDGSMGLYADVAEYSDHDEALDDALRALRDGEFDGLVQDSRWRGRFDAEPPRYNGMKLVISDHGNVELYSVKNGVSTSVASRV